MVEINPANVEVRTEREVADVTSTQGMNPANVELGVVAKKVSDSFGPEMGWEFREAAEHPLWYPIERTAADIIPFASFLFPSGRQEFKEMSLLGKTASLALDALVFLPARWLGTGLKVAASPVAKPIEKGLKLLGKKSGLALLDIAETPKPVLDSLMRKMDEFVPKFPKTELARVYGLTDDEARAVLEGEGKLWHYSGRSGGYSLGRTEATAKLYNAEGKISGKVAKEIKAWSRSIEEQRLAHEIAEYSKRISQYDMSKIFDSQVSALFGPEYVGKLSLKNIGYEDFHKVLLDTLLNEGKVLRRTDIRSFLWGAIQPFRIIAGKWDDLYGTLGLKNRIGDTIKLANRKALQYIKQFQDFQVSHGLGEFNKKGIFKEFYSRDDWREAGKMITELDNAQSAGRSVAPIWLSRQGRPTVQKLVKSYQEWTDYAYADYLKAKIPEVFEKAGITDIGRDALWSMLSPEGQRMSSYITEVLAAGNNIKFEIKHKVISNILKKFRDNLIKNKDIWLQEPTEKNVKNLLAELSFRQGQSTRGVADYLENYGARILDPAARGKMAAKVGAALAKNVTPGFERGRSLVEAGEVIEDLGERVAIRARQQSRQIVLNPVREGFVKRIKALPPNLSKTFQHYFARLTGAQSEVDKAVAEKITAAFGKYWNAERVTNLAYRINDLVYLGGLGFKPFSALRNLFQVPLNVPADMGGIKDVYWLTVGLRRGYAPATRQWVRDAGIITEYAPDILFRPVVSRFAKGARLEKIRDLGLWMFKSSDQHNRYWTSGAALEKWDYMFRKFSKETRGHTILETEKFRKGLNLNSRRPWVRKEINELLGEGTAVGFEEARKAWVRDVVADTQYLYGPLESPVIGQTYGSISRTAVVFQSWWMNYASMLEKWLTTGTLEESGRRLLPWMIASGVGYHMMENIWGAGTAARTVFLGPLPTQLDTPATWRPFVDALTLTFAVAGMAPGITDIDTAKRRFIATFKSGMIFVPGGLQLTKTVPDTLEKGFPGFVGSFFKYQPKR